MTTKAQLLSKQEFKELVTSVRSCTLCAEKLASGVRPVLQVSQNARILIAGQAPGAKVHNTGIPFDDPSGDRLREWMGIDKSSFYNADEIAILPMGFCYPGKGKSGDLPPIRVCASSWRNALLSQLPDIKLTLAIGQYAQAWHLPDKQPTLTATVQNWKSYSAGLIPLPHPSPRNNIWLKRNPWFTTELLPQLKTRVKLALKNNSHCKPNN